jgi:dienelactone hydrolase
VRIKRLLLVALISTATAAALILGPVVIARFRGHEARQLRGVKLAEVSYHDVRFRNEQQAIDLAGMLLLPDGPGPFPGVVIIHGSGTSRRDNGWYLALAQHLQRSGIVVLLPDKRGSEQSQGNWRTASFDDLATDTLSAIAFLRAQQLAEVSTIGIVGMSQGGHIAPLVASESRDLAFLVDVVGSSTPLYEEFLYEEHHNLRQMGFLPGVSNAIARVSRVYITRVAQREFWRANGDFDPLPYWRQLEIPALALYGQRDTNVNTAASADRLQSLEKPNIKVIVFEGSGHALETPPGQGDDLFRNDALETISAFIKSPPK